MLLRVSLFPTDEGAFVGALNLQSSVLDTTRAVLLVRAFLRLVCRAVAQPEAHLSELAAGVLDGTWGEELDSSSLPTGVTRAFNSHEYAHLSRSGPANMWSSRARSGLHWHNVTRSAWLCEGDGMWKGWQDTGTPCSISTEWEPWANLLDQVISS